MCLLYTQEITEAREQSPTAGYCYLYYSRCGTGSGGKTENFAAGTAILLIIPHPAGIAYAYFQFAGEKILANTCRLLYNPGTEQTNSMPV
jgi:hypothetical protein